MKIRKKVAGEPSRNTCALNKFPFLALILFILFQPLRAQSEFLMSRQADSLHFLSIRLIERGKADSAISVLQSEMKLRLQSYEIAFAKSMASFASSSKENRFPAYWPELLVAFATLILAFFTALLANSTRRSVILSEQTFRELRHERLLGRSPYFSIQILNMITEPVGYLMINFSLKNIGYGPAYIKQITLLQNSNVIEFRRFSYPTQIPVGDSPRIHFESSSAIDRNQIIQIQIAAKSVDELCLTHMFHIEKYPGQPVLTIDSPVQILKIEENP